MGTELEAKIASLRKQKEAMRSYLLLKFESDDSHGITDAAMDIREIDAQIKAYQDVLAMPSGQLKSRYDINDDTTKSRH